MEEILMPKTIKELAFLISVITIKVKTIKTQEGFIEKTLIVLGTEEGLAI